MKTVFRIFFGFLLSFPFLISGAKSTKAADDYSVNLFKSEIVVNQDTSIRVKETGEANFEAPKHGIFRIIPVSYNHKGKTINIRLRVIGIKDEKGKAYKFETSRLGQSISLKIGDPDRTLTGPVAYFIEYEASGVLRKYDRGYELYWNATGSEWDTQILNAQAKVSSPFAAIEMVDCFSG